MDVEEGEAGEKEKGWLSTTAVDETAGVDFFFAWDT